MRAARNILSSVALAFLAGLAPLAGAQAPSTGPGQAYPGKPVRIVVPYPPGGGIDILARLIAQRLATTWGQPVLVENKPGSSTILGTESVARSPADGHTILLTTDSSMSINPHLFSKLPYDPVRDFAPVTMLALLQQLLVAHQTFPPNTLRELIALAKARPNTVNYASYGSGSQPHLAGEMLKSKADIDLVHVPYKGISFAVPAALAGEVQLTFSGIASSQAHIKAGRLKALAIGGPRRSPLLPEVPTFAELGYPEVETHAWFGLFVPAGTPRGAIDRILNEPEFMQKEIVAKGYDPAASSPEEFAAFLKKDSESRGRAVKISGARAE